jgi:hypothetical protein
VTSRVFAPGLSKTATYISQMVRRVENIDALSF